MFKATCSATTTMFLGKLQHTPKQELMASSLVLASSLLFPQSAKLNDATGSGRPQRGQKLYLKRKLCRR